MAFRLSLSTWKEILTKAIGINDATLMAHMLPRRIHDGKAFNWFKRASSNSSRRSSVLVLLTPLQVGKEVHDFYMTLTMRSPHLRTHKGQLSFPGGRQDLADDGFPEPLELTAMREALEEVGIAPFSYDIIGSLSDVWSHPSSCWVTPFVAIARTIGNELNDNSLLMPEGRAFIASPDEVESLHFLRLMPLLTHSKETHLFITKYYPLKEGRTREGFVSNDLTGYLMPCFLAQDSCPHDTITMPITAEPSFIIKRDNHSNKTFSCKQDIFKSFAIVDMNKNITGHQFVWGLTCYIICELLCRVKESTKDFNELNEGILDMDPSNFCFLNPDDPQLSCFIPSCTVPDSHNHITHL